MPLRRPPDTIRESCARLAYGGFRYAKILFCVFCSAPPGPAFLDRMLVCRTPYGYISCCQYGTNLLSRNACGLVLPPVDSRSADCHIFTFPAFCLYCRCFLPKPAAVCFFFQSLRFYVCRYCIGSYLRFRRLAGPVPASVFRDRHPADFLLVLSALLYRQRG